MYLRDILDTWVVFQISFRHPLDLYVCLVTTCLVGSYFNEQTTDSSVRDAFTRHGILARNSADSAAFFSVTGLVGSITRRKSSSECFVELDSAASSFQKSAPENCATELTRRKLEIFPGDRSYNVSFSGRSFHRFPVTAITIRSIMTRRTTFVRRRDYTRRRCHISLHYRALLLRKSIACKEKDA